MSDDTKKPVADTTKAKAATKPDDAAKVSKPKAAAKSKPEAKASAKSAKPKATGKTAKKSAAKPEAKSAGKAKSTTMTLGKGVAKAKSGDKGKDASGKPEVEVKIIKSRRKKSATDSPTDSPSDLSADSPIATKDEVKTEGVADANGAAASDAASETPDTTPEVAKAVAIDSLTSDQITDQSDASDKAGDNDRADDAPVYEAKIDSLGRAYATGRRKEAAARVWIKPGSGQVSVNGRDVKIYFARPVLRMILGQPFAAAGRIDAFDVMATVRGGGLSGQAGAVRHGISHALIRFEPSLRPRLKAGGFLTRDSRAVERKKYGRRKARRSFQFSKR